MPAVLHIWSHDAAHAAAVVSDVVELDGAVDGSIAHRLIASAGLVHDVDSTRLGRRLLPQSGPERTWSLRDVVVIDGVRTALRELTIKHRDVAVHAHGPRARTIAGLCGAPVVIVDNGDERSAHRLLAPASRVVFATHDDLDDALDDDDTIARRAALVPMPRASKSASKRRDPRYAALEELYATVLHVTEALGRGHRQERRRRR